MPRSNPCPAAPLFSSNSFAPIAFYDRYKKRLQKHARRVSAEFLLQGGKLLPIWLETVM
jgi:hypothetical protein